VRTALHKPIGQVPLPLELDIAALHSDTGQLEGLVHNRNQSNRKKRMRHCNERRVAAVETNNPTLCVSRCRFSAAK